jgi:hypothetical protein
MGSINFDLLLDPTDCNFAGDDCTLRLPYGHAYRARSRSISRISRTLCWAQSYGDDSLRETMAYSWNVSGHQHPQGSSAAGCPLHLHLLCNSTTILAI